MHQGDGDRIPIRPMSTMGLGHVKTLCRKGLESDASRFLCLDYAVIAAISSWMPMMFSRGWDCRRVRAARHFDGDLGQPFHQEVGGPILIVSVPKGCSTVSGRCHMACGFMSRRLWTARAEDFCLYRPHAGNQNCPLLDPRYRRQNPS